MKLCLEIDPDCKHTKFESPMHVLLPKAVTEIAFKNRSDSGYRLLSRCVRHIMCTKKISEIKIIKIEHDGKENTCFEWSSLFPASMKGQTYENKITVSYDGELFCCECTCKDGGRDNEEKDNNVEKNKLCFHGLSNFMKLSIMLFDYLADDMCFELCALFKRKKINMTRDENEMSVTKECILILASVALTQRNVEVTYDLKEKSMHHILQTYFDVETEKFRASQAPNSMHPIEHLHLTYVDPSSMIASAKKLF